MRRSSRIRMPPTRRSATRRSNGSAHCGWCTRWRRRSAGSILIRRRSWWRSGGPPHPRASPGLDAPQRPKSLVLGASADYVVGMDLDEGKALLADLLDRATQPDLVYSHRWSVGDTVIWDNNGVLHRAAPYDPDSPRECRTTVLGDEPIQ